MRLSEAVLTILRDSDRPLSYREIGEEVKRRFPEQHLTPARVRNKIHYRGDPDGPLFNAITTFISTSPKVATDRTATPMLASLAESNDDWTDEELEAAVRAYLDMREKSLAGIPFVKAAVYRELGERFGRTAKAFEFRMQNISYVLAMLGQRRIEGLAPAKNIGVNVGRRVQVMLEAVTGRVSSVDVAEKMTIAKARKGMQGTPDGVKHPASQQTTAIRYVRDKSVKAWVLNEANGICDCCGSPAPFVDVTGDPFLEVHHVRPLAERGADTTWNAVALCPNCHRRLHYGVDAPELIEKLYVAVSRLRKEGI